MILMAIIMALPLLGLVLFRLYPWQVALLPYAMLVVASAMFDVLMMRGMRLPVSTGREGMIGSTAAVLNWHGGTGQVSWKGEIWRAEYRGRLAQDQTVVIEDVHRLTLLVKPTG
jgi:membrane protein implicated in regulation of membrane protease activity